MKKYIIILILSLVSIPTIAMASWWNPRTWFKPVSGYDSEKVLQNQVSASNTNELSSSTILEVENPKLVPTEKIVERIIERPVEKIVTKTVKVSDPSLLNEVENLRKENKELTDSLKKFQDALVSCKSSETIKPTITNNAKAVRIKLAELDQLEYVFKNEKNSETVRSSMNNFRKIDGTRLYDQTYFYSISSDFVFMPNGDFLKVPDKTILLKILNDYRVQLKIDLEKAQ